MDIQNHYYGHSAALAAYAGLPRPRHVAGLLQHGWTTISPAAVQLHDFPSVGRTARRRLLVWSHGSRAWNPADEPRTTTPIGAPFLYLEAMARAAGWPTRTHGTVCLPVHGTRLIRVKGDHGALARSFADTEGPLTVCLHSEDLGDAQVVDAWQAAGHSIVCAGTRDDPLFLLRILGLVAGARRVVSNRLGTAVLYAAAVGTDVAVYGDPLTLTSPEVQSVESVETRWPELHGRSIDLDVATPLARAELGAQHLLQPDALRAVLGWRRRPSLGPALDYWAVGPLRKALQVLGVSERGDDAVTPEAGLSPLVWLRHPLAHLPRPLPRTSSRPTQIPRPLETAEISP